MLLPPLSHEEILKHFCANRKRLLEIYQPSKQNNNQSASVKKNLKGEIRLFQGFKKSSLPDSTI
jgi:hypothetical protein